MHGTFQSIDIPTESDKSAGWEPYIPGLFSRNEVRRQIGHLKFVYCMRKRMGFWKSLYRECTPAEFSDIEKRDGDA